MKQIGAERNNWPQQGEQHYPGRYQTKGHADILEGARDAPSKAG